MCGFVGLLGENTDGNFESLKSSLALIQHRGPDASEIESNENYIFGHNRLAIVDLDKRSNQPFKDDRYTLVYNGEIYNHLDLRKSKLGDISFETSSDTETLFEGLKKYGQKFLDEVDGMFSGVFFDTQSKQSIAFRDSFGIKPIYYIKKDKNIIFASEIKCFLPFTKLSFCNESIKTYLTFENIPQGRTLYSDVHELKPGEVISFGLNLDFQINLIEKRIMTYENTSESRRDFVDTVKEHLMSDVDLGVYLSGGIDSSLIAGVAAKYAENVKGYTGYFDVDDDHYDERYYARLVAKMNKIELKEVEITHVDFEESFDELNWALEQPRMGMGSFSQFIVAKEVKKERKVVLAGHGGDELFAGYPMFKSCFIQENLFNIRKSIQVFRNIKIKEVIWITYAFFSKVFYGRFYFAPKIFNFKNSSEHKFSNDKRKNILNSLFKYYESVYIPGLLSVEDKVSMANSIETRVPLWSRGLYRFADSFSADEKMPRGELKGLWKQLAKDFIPEELLTAPKRGFPTPLRIWFKNELYDYCLERLKAPSPLDSIIPPKKRVRVLKNHKSKWLPFSLDERRAHKIWMFLCFESIGRQYVK